MSELVQILPPLRQSMVETAACPRSYVALYIEGKGGDVASVPSERGSDIHHVMSQYVDHCTKMKVEADWIYFNTLSAASGPVAGPILDGIRDRYRVDWEHVFGTEVTLSLDEEFDPTKKYDGVKDGPFGVAMSGREPAYTGTLDVILISDDGTRAKINDYKSHPAPFDAEGHFQALLYSFMLLKHLPNIQRVTFELDFVRYQNCLRSVVYRRTDMPQMQTEISRARERQRITHEHPEDAQALPCKVCVYCPLAKNLTCPIAEWNEYLAFTPSDRLRHIEWIRRMRALHMPIIKAHAEVNGPVSYEDGNGKRYEYGNIEVPSTRYPLDRTTIQILDDWKAATGEDMLDGMLNISSTKLKSRLNAKKRAALKEQFEESIIETTTKPKWAVRTPDEGFIEDYNPYEQED